MNTSKLKLEEFLSFHNGKAPNLSEAGDYRVYGSNGLIGAAEEFNHEPAIILGRVGAYCGSVEISEDRFWASDNTIVVRPHNGSSLKYAYYLLKTLSLRSYAGGAAQPLLTQSVLKHVEAKVHPPDHQNRIAEILSAYDDLIENNRRRIQLLEESARLLYREWFVHLRFPGHEHVKVLDGVPEGWELVPFSDLAKFINGYPFKSAHFVKNGWPVVKIPELREGLKDDTPQGDPGGIPERHHISSGDLIFSWSGSLVVDLWGEGKALLNQHLFKVEPFSHSKAFLLLCLREALPRFMNQTVGSTMKHIRKSALEAVSVPVTPSSLATEFEEYVDDIYRQILNLRQQNKRLAEARDLLLPRLMNGEIAV